MKTRRIIFLILGSLLVILNLLIYISGISPAIPPQYKGDVAYTAGYRFGQHIFTIFGIIFLFVAYKAHIKIKARQRDEWLNAFNEPKGREIP